MTDTIDPTKKDPLDEKYSDPRLRYTTEAQVKEFAVLFDSAVAWRRENSKDKALYRVLSVFPTFSRMEKRPIKGGKGEEWRMDSHCANEEELVNMGTEENPIMGFNYVLRCLVQRYTESPGPDPKLKVKNPLGDFQIDAWKFLDDFEKAT